jgi:hypothetical protein
MRGTDMVVENTLAMAKTSVRHAFEEKAKEITKFMTMWRAE